MQAVDNVHGTAQALKKEIAELRTAIQTSPQAATAALASAKPGAYAQQLELAKAYLHHLPILSPCPYFILAC